MTVIRACKMCGKTFITMNSIKAYCSTLCKEREYRKVKMGTHVCPVCGKEFITARADKVYCSRRCRYAHGRGETLEPMPEPVRSYKRMPATLPEQEIDERVAEAQASWSSDYPDLGDDEIYGNMVAL